MANNPRVLENLTRLDSKRAAEIGAIGGRNKRGSVHIKTLAKQIFNDPETWGKIPLADVEQIRKRIGKDKSVGQALIYAWLTKANSDPRFANIILELTDGKSKQEIDQNISGELRTGVADPKLAKAFEEFMEGKKPN